MPSLSNVKIGVCSVTLGGVDLGHTKDGVSFKIDRKFKDLTVDQYGDTPVDFALTGQEVTVEVPLAEVTLDNLNVAVPEGAHAQAGSGVTLKERLGIGTDSGYLLSADAKQLILHPTSKAAGDDTEDITLYKVVPVDAIALDYKIDAQRVVKVTFKALVSETYGSGRRLGHIGSANIS